MSELQKSRLFQRLGMLSILLAMCTIIGLAVQVWGQRPRAVTPDEWIQLQKGMSAEEVRELFGEPLSIAPSAAGGEAWEYDLADTAATYVVFLRFEDGQYVGLDARP
jgi:outer membrane protein assembly factor BamE (lipoprotein component of BamABCDE complex)